MKNHVFALLFIASVFGAGTQAKGQITLDHTYQSANTQLYMVNLEYSGLKYIIRSQSTSSRYIKLYNLNHSLWKTIDLNGYPKLTYNTPSGPRTQNIHEVLYITEALFDCDSALEFMYVLLEGGRYFTGIYKENGTAVFTVDSCAPALKINVPQEQRPIYNTPGGTKMILSHMNGTARVYNVPCTLKNPLLVHAPGSTTEGAMNVFPNPADNRITVSYKLPAGYHEGTLIVVDANGREIKRYTVDDTFSSLSLSSEDLSAGTYFYSLYVNGERVSTRQLLVMR